MPQSSNPFFSIDSLGNIQYYLINQVDRINGMRLEIFSSSKTLVYTNTFNSTNTIQKIAISQTITATTSFQTTETINLIPDISGLYQHADRFNLDQTDFAAVRNEQFEMQKHASYTKLTSCPLGNGKRKLLIIDPPSPVILPAQE
jgi:hypothetical protein